MNSASDPIISPPAFICARLAKALSSSDSVAAFSIRTSSPSVAAAACSLLDTTPTFGLDGLTSAPKTVAPLLRPAEPECDVPAFDEPRLAQPLPECAQPAGVALRRCAGEEANHRHRRLLRPRTERPRRRRAAEQRKEIAPFHCPLPSVR